MLEHYGGIASFNLGIQWDHEASALRNVSGFVFNLPVDSLVDKTDRKAAKRIT